MTDERRKRPSYPWYPGDWKRDTAVQACPPLTRHIWREMLDIMHDGEPYGHLTAGGVAISPEALAGMLSGVTLAQVRRALAELEARHVFSRTPEGVIYSRRQVKDEALRTVRAAGGKDSLDNPNVPRPKGEKDSLVSPSEERLEDGPKDTLEDGADPRARDRACRAANANAVRTSKFDQFWEAYPRKVGKGAAKKAFDRLKVSDALLEIMLSAILLQRASRDWQKDGGQFIPYPATWLNAGRWDDEVQPDPVLARKVGPVYQADDWFAECQHDPKCQTGPMHRQRVDIEAMKAGAA